MGARFNRFCKTGRGGVLRARLRNSQQSVHIVQIDRTMDTSPARKPGLFTLRHQPEAQARTGLRTSSLALRVGVPTACGSGTRESSAASLTAVMNSHEFSYTSVNNPGKQGKASELAHVAALQNESQDPYLSLACASASCEGPTSAGSPQRRDRGPLSGQAGGRLVWWRGLPPADRFRAESPAGLQRNCVPFSSSHNR